MRRLDELSDGDRHRPLIPLYEGYVQLHRGAELRRSPPPAEQNWLMRAVLLGGAGEVGAEVARDLARVAEFDSLVIADVDERARAPARARARRIRESRPARSTSATASRHCRRSPARTCCQLHELRAVRRGARAGLAARVDYADLISEPSERSGGPRARPGSRPSRGWAPRPGSSNVLVRHAADELDELHDVDISWISSRTVAPLAGLA